MTHSQISHISLRRCLYTYISQEMTDNITQEQLQHISHVLHISINEQSQYEFVSYNSDELIHQQSITYTLNVLNPFTFH